MDCNLKQACSETKEIPAPVQRSDGGAINTLRFGVPRVDFVLRGAGESAVCFDGPERVVGFQAIRWGVERPLEFGGVFVNAAAAFVFQPHDPIEFFAVDAIGIVDEAIRIGERDHSRAEVKQLLDRVLRNVAAAGDEADFAFEGIVAGLQHFQSKINAAVAGGLRTDQRAAQLRPLPVRTPVKRSAMRLYWPKRKPISRPPTPMSPAGTSVSAPMWRYNSLMKLWQKRITSLSLLPLGSKSEPPLPPPIGSVVSEFFSTCSNARNFRMPRFTEGWNRRPPLYGPMALFISMRNPRFTWTCPASSTHGTRNISTRSGSMNLSSNRAF